VIVRRPRHAIFPRYVGHGQPLSKLKTCADPTRRVDHVVHGHNGKQIDDEDED
jgi:hypothetical protein